MAQENNKWEFAQIGRNEFGQLLIINDTRKVEMNFRDCLTLLEAKGIMFDILSVPELQSKVKELEERNKALEDALRTIEVKGLEIFNDYSNGKEVDFKSLCGAFIETVKKTLY